MLSTCHIAASGFGAAVWTLSFLTPHRFLKCLPSQLFYFLFHVQKLPPPSLASESYNLSQFHSPRLLGSAWTHFYEMESTRIHNQMLWLSWGHLVTFHSFCGLCTSVSAVPIRKLLSQLYSYVWEDTSPDTVTLPQTGTWNSWVVFHWSYSSRV